MTLKYLKFLASLSRYFFFFKDSPLTKKKLEESNTAISQQILDLQKKIEDNKNRLGQISGEVTEQSAKINANKDSFEATHLSFVEQIKSDLNKINQYLK